MEDVFLFGRKMNREKNRLEKFKKFKKLLIKRVEAEEKKKAEEMVK